MFLLAISALIDSPQRLIERFGWSLDVAIVYGSPMRAGLITELLLKNGWFSCAQVRATKG